jgi:hypothetical protein
MHGANLFPDIPLFREIILEYLAVMTQLGHAVMAGIALSLNLEASYFRDRYTTDPLILFRIFNYPPQSNPQGQSWGVGEHTDYGLLTILKQDDLGGLQVKTKSGWIDAPPISPTHLFVTLAICSIGSQVDFIALLLIESRMCQDDLASHFPFSSIPISMLNSTRSKSRERSSMITRTNVGIKPAFTSFAALTAIMSSTKLQRFFPNCARKFFDQF